jgi:hypothetical protein
VRRLARARTVPVIAAVGFLLLVVAGNALQGATPALHGDADDVVAFYSDRSTAIAVGMMLSLWSLFFLAWFLAALRDALEAAEGPDGRGSAVAATGGTAALALMAGGFAMNSAGALRARESDISPESAVVFYDAGLALSGLAAPLALAVLLAGTAWVSWRGVVFPRWFTWVTVGLTVLGLVTPLSFLLFLLFPLWVVSAGVLLGRAVAVPEPMHRPAAG